MHISGEIKVIILDKRNQNFYISQFISSSAISSNENLNFMYFFLQLSCFEDCNNKQIWRRPNKHHCETVKTTPVIIVDDKGSASDSTFTAVFVINVYSEVPIC